MSTDPILSTLDTYRAKLQRLGHVVAAELGELDKLRTVIRVHGPASDAARRACGLWDANRRVTEASIGVLANSANDWRDVNPFREEGAQR